MGDSGDNKSHERHAGVLVFRRIDSPVKISPRSETRPAIVQIINMQIIYY